MRFHVVLTNLETHIFTTPPTFHGHAIGNHDLKIIDGIDIEISFLGNAAMNKIMGPSTINKDDYHMRFHVVLTNLEMHIFTMPPTFHGHAIGNHDLKIIDGTDIALSFLENAVMNKIMGPSTINKDDYLHMLNVTN
jgi:hypothetical protein